MEIGTNMSEYNLCNNSEEFKQHCQYKGAHLATVSAETSQTIFLLEDFTICVQRSVINWCQMKNRNKIQRIVSIMVNRRHV